MIAADALFNNVSAAFLHCEVEAVIHAMRDLYGACEWIEPKLKRPRKRKV